MVVSGDIYVGAGINTSLLFMMACHKLVSSFGYCELNSVSVLNKKGRERLLKTDTRHFDSIGIKKAWKGAHENILERMKILYTYVPQHLRITAVFCLVSQWDKRVWHCAIFGTQGGAGNIVSLRLVLVVMWF